MLRLHNPVTFGNFSRFQAYQYNTPHNFDEEYQTVIFNRSCIFVQDAEQEDRETGLPLIVFQEWSSKIESLEQVIPIVRKRFPDAFVELD